MSRQAAGRRANQASAAASPKSSVPSGNPPRRRPGRPTLTNEQLLDTALDLFLEHGFERTSIDAITTAAGMAKRTVYARYGDKLTLFKAALRRAIDEWILPIEELRAAECEDLETTLVRIGRLLVTNILSPAGLRLLRLTNAEANRVPEIGAYNVRLGTEPTLAYLADLLRRRLPKGAAHADEAAQAFLGLVVGGPASNAAWGVPVDRSGVEAHTRYSVRLFLDGVRPPRDAGGDDLADLLEQVATGLDDARATLLNLARKARD